MSATDALRVVLARITGTTAEHWLARDHPPGDAPLAERYPGTLADFIRATLANERSPREGRLLSAVVDLLPLRAQWSVAELKDAVRNHGVEASPKQLYNALGYLTRRRRVRRVGYGRYAMPATDARDKRDEVD